MFEQISKQRFVRIDSNHLLEELLEVLIQSNASVNIFCFTLFHTLHEPCRVLKQHEVFKLKFLIYHIIKWYSNFIKRKLKFSSCGGTFQN